MAIGLTRNDPGKNGPCIKDHNNLPGAWLMNIDGTLYRSGKKMGIAYDPSALSDDVFGVSWNSAGISFYRCGRVVHTWLVDGPKQWDGVRRHTPARSWDTPPGRLWVVFAVTQASRVAVTDPFPNGTIRSINT